jgi:hypothetical protein
VTNEEILVRLVGRVEKLERLVVGINDGISAAADCIEELRSVVVAQRALIAGLERRLAEHIGPEQ